MTEPDDAALLDAAQRGDTAATAALVTRHAARVVRFARSLCDNPMDADEASQEAMIAAYHGIRGVRSASALPSWLYAVTRSFCGKQRRRARAGDLPLEDAPPVASGAAGPEDDASRREVAGALTAALHALDPKYREVVWLRDVEGLTAPEVAESLGMEVAAVKTRLHRGRSQLRTRMAPILGGARGGPACPNIVERFSRYLEGDIGAGACAELKAHVDGCATCNAACEALKRTVGLCGAQRTELPPALEARLRQALANAIGSG